MLREGASEKSGSVMVSAAMRAAAVRNCERYDWARKHRDGLKANPTSLRYMLRTRYGSGLETQFVSVIEPYNRKPFIASVRALENTIDADNGVAAVEIVLADGRRDVVTVSENGGEVTAGGVRMKGRVGFSRFRGEEAELACLIEGRELTAGGAELSLPAAAVTGTLAGWDDSDPAGTLLKLDGPLPDAQAVEGKYIIFANKERSDASYRIVKVVDARTVSIGANSLIERFKDPGDYKKGVVHTIAPGDRFRIALSAKWEKKKD